MYILEPRFKGGLTDTHQRAFEKALRGINSYEM